jgi:septation ring formation regulator EzrA
MTFMLGLVVIVLAMYGFLFAFWAIMEQLIRAHGAAGIEKFYTEYLPSLVETCTKPIPQKHS